MPRSSGGYGRWVVADVGLLCRCYLGFSSVSWGFSSEGWSSTVALREETDRPGPKPSPSPNRNLHNSFRRIHETPAWAIRTATTSTTARRIRATWGHRSVCSRRWARAVPVETAIRERVTRHVTGRESVSRGHRSTAASSTATAPSAFATPRPRLVSHRTATTSRFVEMTATLATEMTSVWRVAVSTTTTACPIYTSSR